MIIANPIFDVVFKRLMEDKRAAKFFIETLTEETIADIQIQPKNSTPMQNGVGFQQFEFRITSKSGLKQFWVEIQKFRSQIEFEKQLILQQNISRKMVEEKAIHSFLPIIRISFLDFVWPEVKLPVAKEIFQYTDMMTGKVVQAKIDFIEDSVADRYIIQIPGIHSTEAPDSNLDKLLSIFEQNYFVDERGIIKEYNYDVEDETMKSILGILHHTGTEPKERKEIEDEQELWRSFADYSKPIIEKLGKRERALKRAELKLEKQKALNEEQERKNEEQQKINEALQKENKELKEKLGEK